jgi:hypothetical protein
MRGMLSGRGGEEKANNRWKILICACFSLRFQAYFHEHVSGSVEASFWEIDEKGWRPGAPHELIDEEACSSKVLTFLLVRGDSF